MSLEALTIELIAGDSLRMQCLAAVRELGLPDGFIVAGFVRNLIWDELHGYAQRTPLNDVDVAFFNQGNVSPETERLLEERLCRKHPEVAWQVRNQARMHSRNGHPPYRDTADAMAHFPETATCVGVRLTDPGWLEICAPHGLEPIWALELKPNRKAGYPESVFEGRVSEKRWRERWPKLEANRQAQF